MKNHIYITLALLSLLFSGCEKMVDLDLKSIEPQLVIDAYITDQTHNERPPCSVTLSLTQDYYAKESAKTMVSGAQVYLSVDNGMSVSEEQLTETKTGVYTSDNMGVAGYTYTLRVIVDGKEYQSTATLPETTHVEELYIYSFELDGKYWFTPCVTFNDPAGIVNYYYYSLWINGRKMMSIDFDDDLFFDGLYKERLLFFDKEENLDEDLVYGDRVEVEVQSIAQGAFKFYQSLYSIASGGGTNPIGNISGGVLGCFKAYGSSRNDIPYITEDNVVTREL